MSPKHKSAHQLVFDHYLRTGERLTTEEWLLRNERKFNPYHDELGRFTSPPGVTVSWGNHRARLADQPNGWRRTGADAAQGSASSAVAGGQSRSGISTGARMPRGSTAKRSTLLPPKSLHAPASAIRSGHNELLIMPKLDVVIFGPGVSLVPVPIATFQEFDAAAKLASRMSDLDAVITGPQSTFLHGSEGLNGQAVVGGRVYGKSAPGLYYFATSTDDHGVRRLEFGKGDPPRTGGEVGIGGGVPMLINGQNVGGYNIAWSRHRGLPGTGKNIIAYNSSQNTSAIFIQPNGREGYPLESVREYIRNSGYDYALMFDGSGSVSLNYQGDKIVSPEIIRQALIHFGIGFRSR